ncbi:MAG: ribosome biogenesis GTPase Der, partial [Bacteroidales bacterium]|nr:ribosome biogenesis GTPase Der [Bacteroidales bacterium]
GSGTGELLDAVVKEFETIETEEIPDLPKITVAGRPNVGKSSLINAFLGEERFMVTPIAGTTRDSIYTRYNKFGHDFFLVDTAGMRKKGKVSENIEFYSVLRSIRAIENCDICLLMIDASQGIETQDLNIIHLVERNRKGIVIVVNKWDLVDKETNTSIEFEKEIKRKIAPFVDVPIVFTSIPNKQRILKVLELSMLVYQNRIRKISTSKLNDVMLPIVKAQHPPSVKGKFVKIKYITQIKTHYPSFAFFCNLPQYVKEPYKRFVENKLRKYFDFTGVPIQIYFRKK